MLMQVYNRVTTLQDTFVSMFFYYIHIVLSLYIFHCIYLKILISELQILAVCHLQNVFRKGLRL